MGIGEGGEFEGGLLVERIDILQVPFARVVVPRAGLALLLDRA